MMTDRQRQAMLFIERYQAERGGVSPTLRDIAMALKVRKTSVFRILTGLEERGFIRRLPNRQRAIEVLRPVTREQWFQFCNETKEVQPFSPKKLHNAQKKSRRSDQGRRDF